MTEDAIRSDTGPSAIQQTQGTTPEDIRAKGRHLADAFRDVIEQSEHLVVSSAQPTAPLSFISLVSAEESDDSVATALTGQVGKSLNQFYLSNQGEIDSFLSDNKSLAEPVKDQVKSALANAGVPSDSSWLGNNIATFITAILVSGIIAEQGATSAKLGVVGAESAVDLNKEQLASAASQEASTKSQAQASLTQAQSEMTSSTISMVFGALSGVLAIASFATSWASEAGEAMSQSVKDVETATATATIKAPTTAATPEAEAAEVAPIPAAAAAGRSAVADAEAAPEAPAEDEAATAATKAKAETQTKWAQFFQNTKRGMTPTEKESFLSDLKSNPELAKELQTYKNTAAWKTGWGKWAQLSKSMSDFSSTIGGSISGYVRGNIASGAYAETTTQAAQQYTSSTQQALGNLYQSFQQASEDTAKNSLSNAQTNAQAFATITGANAQAAQAYRA